MVSIGSSRIEAFVNASEVVNITVDANPTNYTTEWMKDGKELKPSDMIEVKRDALIFEKLSGEDGGNYTVKVENIQGSVLIHFELAVFGKITLIALSFFF